MNFAAWSEECSMTISKSRLARTLAFAIVANAALASIGAERVYASGPGDAALFSVLSDGFTGTGSAKVSGDVGGSTVQLTDKASVKGNVIARAGSGVALELGDNAKITGKCVTGGGTISIVAAHPAKCGGGKDTSGSDPLLTTFNNALNDVDLLVTVLDGLTPTMSLSEIDLAPKTKMTMTFPNGTSVVAVTGRMLMESGSKLTIKAPAGASVIFLIGTLFTTQSSAKVSLSGGIKPGKIAYVLNGDVTLGTKSSVMGTLIAPSGNCMLDHGSKLDGAVICNDSVTFEGKAKLSFAPLASTFP
jgi:choice-of-anchor A domain-containing protein